MRYGRSMKYACLLIGLFGLFSASVSSACTAPAKSTITYSWSAGAVVTVNYDSTVNSSTILSELQAVVTSWNAALAGSLGSYATSCNPPQFTFGSGNASIHLTYGPIPPALVSAGTDIISASTTVSVTRGLTDLPHATLTTTTPRRLLSVNMYINSGVTAVVAATEVLAHEFGHTVGVSDCYAPSPCAFHSSVMNSQQPGTAPVSGGVNGSIGTPGPTVCDIAQIGIVVYDYNCADSPPGTQDCTPCYYGASLQGTGKPKLLPVQVPGQCCSVSPVVVDVSGKGFVLTDAQDGVKFDITGTGNLVQMGWTASGADNAFLALPGPDGLIHSGKQLFGNFTPQPPGTYNGFAALAVYDQLSRGGNGDGVIDKRDAIFSSLRLWIDSNHDGISQPEELHTLPSMGVNSISLKYHLERRTDQYGNVFRYAAQVNPGDPANVGKIAYDIFFGVLNPDGSIRLAQTKCVLPPPRP
jgi:hypothetical protein